MVEPLTEQDLETLTKFEAKLLHMRKRETAHRNRLTDDLSRTIKEVHWIRQMLQGRFGLPTDPDIS